MTNDGEITMMVSPKSKDSRWVAIGDNDKIISEGTSPNEVLNNAKVVAENFFLMFVPIEGASYVF